MVESVEKHLEQTKENWGVFKQITALVIGFESNPPCFGEKHNH